MNTHLKWTALADNLAEQAHTRHFASRRGIWLIDDLNVICLYNNNPYARHPSLRDVELTKIRKILKAEGLEEMSFASYPRPGNKDAGYTYALIIAGACNAQWIGTVIRKITLESYDQLAKADGIAVPAVAKECQMQQVANRLRDFWRWN